MAWRARREAWEQVTRDVNGELSTRLGDPSITFRLGDHPAQLLIETFGANGALPYTAVRIQIAHQTGLRMKLVPEKLVQKLSKFLGARDIELGDARFDAAYLVRGSDPERVRALLEPPELRESFHAIRDFELEIVNTQTTPSGQQLGQVVARGRGIDQDAAHMIYLIQIAQIIVRRLGADST